LQLIAAEAEKQALNDTMLLVFIKKRIITCFLYLKEERLQFIRRISKFANLRDLTKHFKQKYLASIKKGDRLKCKVY